MHLRKITETDNRLLRKWRNANREYFPPAPEITMLAQRRWYEGYLLRPHDHMYVVCAPVPIGTVAINVSDPSIHRVMRGEQDGERGAMGAALVELMSVYSFPSYALQVLEGNAKAVKFYENLGFRRAGTQRYNYRDKSSPMMINMFREWHI